MSGMEISGAAGAPRTEWTQAPSPPAQDPAPTPPEEEKSLIEMMQEAREKAEKRREQLKLPNHTRYGDGPIEAHARLARARTPAEVTAAAGYARRRIAQYQAALRRDSDNAERIRAAIRQLQKAVGRAGKKKRDLNQERLAKVRQARAAQENQRREAIRQRQELARKKTMRAIRESGYVREAVVDDKLQAHLAETRMELRAQAQALAPKVSVELAAQQYTATASAAEAAPAPAEMDFQA
ncbi:MAG: hypothetical protein HFF18_09145 [Oscillospiraceae bacterium]|nr:hypothetical protein [Oscillospiraceae bacterium]